VCGDKLTITLRLGDDGRVEDIRFDGHGCAISTASASLMTEFVKGRTVEEVHRAFESFHDLVTGPPGEQPEAGDLGKLAVFAGVREYPMRVKCATLSWHTLNAALEQSAETARTE
jgi:nitrogen fixation NifU-like protein